MSVIVETTADPDFRIVPLRDCHRCGRREEDGHHYCPHADGVPCPAGRPMVLFDGEEWVFGVSGNIVGARAV